jgi:hypothetical protein
MRLRFFTALFLFCGLQAQAHPVAYKDSFGVMSYNSQEANELLVTYSLTARTAAAFTTLREAKSEFYIPRANFLLQRWNNEDSQGNLYFSAGYGAEKYDSKNYDTTLAELIADWESRKYLVALEEQYFRRRNQNNPLLTSQDYSKTKMRLGFAPFLADYNYLNVWYIAEFNSNSENPQIQTTQFLRFYMKNVLWEIGAGFDGSIAFNFMLHL